jgi:small multidrug resistance pump
MVTAFGLLLAAIALEVLATSALPRTEGFRDPLWSFLVVAGYAASIWLLAVVVERMSVSTAYAIWSGLGTASVASWDPVKVVALVMIVCGVVLLNLQGGH